MSFKIGGSASHSSTDENSTSNTSSSSTSTPIVPDWASTLTQNVANQVGGLVGANPQSQVAPVNSLQNLAAANATNLSGTPWDYNAAADLTASVGQAKAPDISSYINQFMNPYLQQVVGATSADLDANDAKVRAQQALSLAGSGAFGGSGAALAQSATEGELDRARATSIGNLLSQGYSQALSGAQAQAQLQQQQMQQRLGAANQLASIGSEYDAGLRANAATQAAVGDDLRNVAQQQAQAPITSTQQVVAMLSGLPINLFTGSQTNGTSSTAASGTKNTDTTSVNASAGGSWDGSKLLSIPL